MEASNGAYSPAKPPLAP